METEMVRRRADGLFLPAFSYGENYCVMKIISKKIRILGLES